MGSLHQTQFSSNQFCHGTSFSVVPIALKSRWTQSIHLCFGLLLLLLRSGIISSVCLGPTYSWSRLFTCPNHLSLAIQHLTVMFSTFSLFLVVSFLTCSVSMWRMIFISVTSSFFTWELVIGTVSIPYSIACRIGPRQPYSSCELMGRDVQINNCDD